MYIVPSTILDNTAYGYTILDSIAYIQYYVVWYMYVLYSIAHTYTVVDSIFTILFRVV